jgi:NADH-quinone oxidoreductase subunit J
MNPTSVLFYIFSAVLLFAGFRVITARNPVHAALFLVLAFFNASCIWMLLQAEFLAIALVLVYVGAVMVLFLFVVMMLDINIDSLRRASGSTSRWRPWSARRSPRNGHRADGRLQPAGGQGLRSGGAQAGQHPRWAWIYTQYLYPLQVAAVLLLVA